MSRLALVFGLLIPAAAAATPAATEPLARVLPLAARDGKPILVLFRAEWCPPCNELGDQVIDSRKGAALLRRVHLVEYEYDSDEGQAAGRRHHVMGLPTALVLRAGATPGGPAAGPSYVEIARIEGFDDARSWIEAVEAALRRRAPTLEASCSRWKTTRDWSAVPCAVAALRGPEAAGAAAWLERLVGAAPPRGTSVRDAVEPGRSLGRYWLRVRGDAARCADTIARTLPAAAKDPQVHAGLVYWRALCLKRAGRAKEALAALDAYEARAGESPKARRAAHELVADLLVHERLAPERARRLLDQILADDPRNDEAHYLLGRLLRDTGHLADARAELAKARALAPKKALYHRFERTLGKP